MSPGKVLIFICVVMIVGMVHTDVWSNDVQKNKGKPMWSPWAKLDDGALNGIEFSHKSECIVGATIPCPHEWRFNSLYETDVELEYTIAWDSGAGIQHKTARTVIKPGENRDSVFTVNAVALDELSVRIVADAAVLKDARKTVAEIKAAELREIEKKKKQAELVARLAAEEQKRQEEARRKEQEEAKRKQAAQEEYWRKNPQEYRAHLARLRAAEEERQWQEQQRIYEAEEQKRQEQEEADRQAHREEQRAYEAEERRRQAREDAEEQRRQEREERAADRRREEQDSRDFNNALMSGLQSMQNSLNQGLSTYGSAVQMRRDADAQIQRDRENREREAREQQRRQSEDSARARREAEEERRIERQRLAKQEDDRRAAENRRREQQERTQREAQAAERERKAKTEADTERKRTDNSGRWVDGSYTVTFAGEQGNRMFLETYLTASVTDSSGSAEATGQYLSIQNSSAKYSAQYATVSGIRGTLAPGETKLIHIPFNNGTGDSYRPTKYPVNIRYFKEE
ncbi:MAG TPA: hypothetical protein HPP97_06835 [Desulfuromonadales bacterium]|nr:hypothetical protein [Desulfuromonadales bacterium]